MILCIVNCCKTSQVSVTFSSLILLWWNYYAFYVLYFIPLCLLSVWSYTVLWKSCWRKKCILWGILTFSQHCILKGKIYIYILIYKYGKLLQENSINVLSFFLNIIEHNYYKYCMPSYLPIFIAVHFGIFFFTFIFNPMQWSYLSL